MTETARRLILVVLVIGMAGIAAELLLLAHDEDWLQFIPLVLLALGVAALVVITVRPSAGAVRAWQGLAVLFVLSGLLGTGLHFQANIEFQLEVDPSLSGLALYTKAARAKAPPALAPGAMVQLGLLGLIFTFRHPSLKP